MPIIVPVAKSLFLCDDTVGFPGGKTDIMGLFNSINAVGLGRVPFYVEIRFAATSQLVFTSNVHQVQFPNRHVTIQLAYTVAGCRLPQSGLYLVELFCDNQWVADVSLVAN